MSIENINNIDRQNDLMGKEFEYELNDDLSKLSLSALKDNIIQSHEKNTSKPGEFLNGHESRDKKYMVYEYTIKSHGTPNAVRAQAVSKGIAQKKEGIQITNGKAIEYPETTKFKAGEKVYVRIPINNVKNKAEKNDTKSGEFLNGHESMDKKYTVYEYTIKSHGTPNAVRAQAVAKGIAQKKEGIQITNGKAIEYPENEKFTAGTMVYVRVPINNPENKPENKPDNKPDNNLESNIKIIDGMKCKGGEYFGIDISKFNEDIDLDEFKKWNRAKWDSEKKDTRGVSFVYIRSGDGITEDPKVGKHINKIKEYNNDKNIKENHEQIAVGFYHRMNSHDGTKQANTFIKTYNKYKDTAGGNKLVPMLDLEGSRIKSTTKEKVREKALTRLRTVEKTTGVIPGIYVTVSLYRDYIGNDSRFNKYLTRIAAYPNSDNKTGREIGTANRINYKTGEVNIGNAKVKPTMYQSSQEGTVGGAYVEVTDGKGKYKKKYMDTDIDHTKDITKLFAKNNKRTK